MGKIINSMIDVVRDEWHDFFNDKSTQTSPDARMEEKLKILYGRGEITKEHFHQLRYRLYRGVLSNLELSSIHQEAVRKQESDRNYIRWKGDPDLDRLLDKMFADQVTVAETRDLLKASLQQQKDNVAWIKEQAESVRQDAQAAMPDETRARAFLQVWQKLLSLAQTLDNDLQVMERDLLKLDSLENEIKAAIIRLQLYLSRERLADLSQRIHTDLVTPGKVDRI
jgi:hypothetical protein